MPSGLSACPAKKGRKANVGVVLAEHERAFLVNILNDHGEEEAADKVSVNPYTYYRALAGMPLRRSTAQCIRSRLRELGESDATDTSVSTQ